MGVIDRLRYFLECKGISKYKFYKTCGIANGFLDREGNIGTDKCEKIIAQYPELNLEWLITGRGEMLRGDDGIESDSGKYLYPQSKSSASVVTESGDVSYGTDNSLSSDEIGAVIDRRIFELLKSGEFVSGAFHRRIAQEYESKIAELTKQIGRLEERVEVQKK